MSANALPRLWSLPDTEAYVAVTDGVAPCRSSEKRIDMVKSLAKDNGRLEARFSVVINFRPRA